MCCGLPNLEDSYKDWFSMEDALAFVQNVYDGKYEQPGSIDKKRTNKYAKIFNDAVDKGWQQGGGKISLDFDTPDAKMLAALRDNAFHFSAAKNRQEIEELSALLTHKGKLRKWEDYRHEAEKVIGKHQSRHLKVEYDMAVNSSYLAARWQEFDDDDILVFRTAGDARVRDSHKALDGIALPKKHPFWKTFYPPLAWNCRCTVEVSHRGGQTAEDQIPWGEIDNVPPIFRSNFAVEGMAFPEGHPYFEETRLIDAKWHHSTIPYEVDKTPNGNRVFESKASHKVTKSEKERKRQKTEYTQNRISARLMADYHKDDVLLMPELQNSKNDVRYVWEYLDRGYEYKPKMADSFLINSEKFYEVKSYEGNYSYDKLSKMINKVQSQSEIGVFYINQDVPIDIIKINLKTYINALEKNKKKLKSKELFVIVNGKLNKIF